MIHSGRQPIRGGKLSLARMLSILALFHISTDKDFKHVWHDGLTQEYRSAFLLAFGTYLHKPRK